MDYKNANYFSIIGTTDCNHAFPKALFPQKKNERISDSDCFKIIQAACECD